MMIIATNARVSHSPYMSWCTEIEAKWVIFWVWAVNEAGPQKVFILCVCGHLILFAVNSTRLLVSFSYIWFQPYLIIRAGEKTVAASYVTVGAAGPGQGPERHPVRIRGWHVRPQASTGLHQVTHTQEDVGDACNSILGGKGENILS